MLGVRFSASLYSVTFGHLFSQAPVPFPFRFLLVLLCTGYVAVLHAQQNNVPLQRDFYIDVERNASQLESQKLTGLKPVIESRADLTNVMGHRVDSTKYYWPYVEKIWKESLGIVDEGDFRLTVDPLFRFEYGDDKGDNTVYADTNRYFHNTRGFRVAGDIGDKVSFQTMFHESQILLPQYLFRQVQATDALSGQGRVKYNARRILDLGWSEGNVSYTPVQGLNVQFGHGKHFVGHGYRSVLLSDHSIGTPYLKFSLLSKSGKLQYSTWHTKLMHDVTRNGRLPTSPDSERLFYWMRARFNQMALLLGRVELGLFESSMFRTIDQTGVVPFDPLELNPIMGVNTLVHGFGSANKSLVGLDMRVKLRNKLYVYGQFATDGPADERYAWQAGVRVFDLIRKDIHLQVEYNTATPFMYQNDPVQMAYVHAGLPLAHPMGAYFNELVSILDLGFGRIIGQAKLNLATYHQDRIAEQNHGSNLNKPQNPLLSARGPLVQEMTMLELNASYLVNPVSNLRLTVGFRRRDLTPASDAQQSSYYFVALSTELFNRYYDL